MNYYMVTDRFGVFPGWSRVLAQGSALLRSPRHMPNSERHPDTPLRFR